MRFEDWQRARKRNSQRFSTPPRWEGEQSTEGTENTEEKRNGGESTEYTKITKRGFDWGEESGDEEWEPENRRVYGDRDDVPFYAPPRDPEEVRAENLKWIEEKLSKVGIRLLRPYNSLTLDETEAVWLEYERRFHGKKHQQVDGCS